MSSNFFGPADFLEARLADDLAHRTSTKQTSTANSVFMNIDELWETRAPDYTLLRFD